MNKLLLVLLLIGFKTTFGQVSISMHNTDYSTDFNGWNGTLPAGFSQSGPTASTTFRGTSASLNSGGVYAVSGNGYSYQASSSASVITLEGTFQNTTGTTITELEISYEAFSVFHRDSRIPSWSVTSSLGNVATLAWDYDETATSASPDVKTITLTGLNISNNGTFTITFESDRGTGSGSTPKVGLNNINVRSISTPPCSISASGLASLTCNDNATPGTSADDFLTFELDPQGTLIGSNYSVSVNTGSISPVSASYGAPTTFTLNNGSAGGGNVIVTITDASGTCTLPVNITDPGACSVPCSVSGTDVQSACGSYTWIDGNTYTANNNSATFTIVGGAASGCDSIITLDLTITNSVAGTDVQSACGSYTWIDGNTYTANNNSATFTIVGGSASGCDSIVTLDLTITNSVAGTDVQSACGSYTWIDGNTYTANNNSATFTIVGGAASGCDSIVTLDLTITNSVAGTDVQSACGSYTWIDGNTYTANNNSATFTIVGGSASGCDSIVTLDLTISNSVAGTDVQSACGSYTWIDGNTYTANNNSATFTIVGGSVNGCDSIVTLDLTITNSVAGTDVQSACGSYTWIDGNTYTANNNSATFTIVGGAANGCDSIVTLDLTISNSVAGTDVQSACGSYTWIDGNTYTANNNSATFTIVGGAANGCDSIVTLDLTISNSVTGTDVQSACGSYTWIDGNTYTANNNSATFTIVGGAANGCDSIVTLDLTISNSVTGTDVQSACGSYTWIDGNTYTANNNSATFTIVGGAASGCDSIVTLDLTINTPDVTVTTNDPSITANAVNATYQWIDCSNNSDIVGATSSTFTATQNGSYAVKVTENGCTSTSLCVSIVTVSLEETVFEDIKIYPNPNSGQFTISLGDIEHPAISIYTVDGKLVYLQEEVNEQNVSIELLDEPGVYFITISKGEYNYSTKVIVQ